MDKGIDITVVLGAFAGMLVGFYGIAKVMLNQASKDRDNDRHERQTLAKAIQDMAGATGRVADATTRSAKEAETRNGHLAELSLQGNQLICEVIENTKNIKDKMDATAVGLETGDKARKRAVRMVKTDLEVK